MHTASATRSLFRGGGLYAVKPRFQGCLRGMADRLAAQEIHPDWLTTAAVGCAALAGAAVLGSPAQPLLLWLVPPLAFTRLALNALDGMVARRLGVERAWGTVLNEMGDRLSDLLFLAPLLAVPSVPAPLAAGALCTVLLGSFVGVLGLSTAAGRQYGGLCGKADRMLWLSLACIASGTTGDLQPLTVVAAALLVGGLITTAQRLRWIHVAL